MSDDSLQWENLRQGDEKALESIFLLHHQELFSYGIKFLPDKAQVDDCIQDLFLELWQRKGQLGHVISIRAYLFRALKYKMIKSIKKKAVYAELAENDEQLYEFGYDNVLVSGEQHAETHTRLMKYIAQLTARQQEALYLRYFCELSYAEIATIMAISAQAVTNLVFKAIKTLRETIYNG